MMSRTQQASREDKVVALVVSLLRHDGYRVRREVSNMGQSADIVATRGRWVTFVEAKVGHWRRALGQCQAHEQVADFVCVALAASGVPEEFLKMSRQRGYGIIHCAIDELTCRWVTRPVRNASVWRPERKRWARLLRTIEYAH